MAPGVLLPTPVPPARVPVPKQDITTTSPADALTPLVQTVFKTSTLTFFLNGTRLHLSNVDPAATLLDFIRSQRGLQGTKLGCGEGGCGACTVVIQQPNALTGRLECLAVNACLAPVISVDGKHVITIEALGTTANPHPLQERLSKLHGSQCGFCTPGIIMSLYALLRNAYDPSAGVYRLTHEMVELEGALDGNLCRCTGYKPILDAARSFVREDLGGVVFEGAELLETGRELGGNWASNSATGKPPSCGRPGGCCRDSPSSDIGSSQEECSASTPASTPPEPAMKYNFAQFEFREYSPRSELIFPAALRKHVYEPLCLGDDKKVWFRPVTLAQLLQLKDAFPAAKLVAGSSEVQVEVKFKSSDYAVCVYVGDIPELKGFAVDEERGEVVIGGNTTLTVIENQCLVWAEKLGARGLALEAVRKQLRYFAGRQIRNMATPAGNIVTASPISDLNPVLVAVGARVIAHSLSKGPQEINMREFFLDYRRTALPEDAVITKIIMPLGHASGCEIVKSYKQAKRKDDDIAIVTAGLRVKLDAAGVVEDVCLAYGGMGPTTVEAKHTQQVLTGKKWFDPLVLEEATNAMEKDFDLPYNVPGGMPTYRKTLAFTFLLRFWHEVAANLKLGEADDDLISELDRHVLISGSRDNDNPYEQQVVGKQIPHLSALKQATGEAEYVDDMPKVDGELFGSFVLSAKAHAKLVEVDFSPALAMPGVHGFVDHHDLPEERAFWGTVRKDERFFAKDAVYAHGQPIGMVVAETAAQAQAAAKAVKVVYEVLPAVISIDEAIAANSFFEYDKMLKRGEPIEEALAKCDHVFSGVSKMGGQEHFYLETNSSLVVPKEGGDMEVWSSTQNTMETQAYVSQVTGIPSHRVVSRVRRLGGGFGGKESRSVQLTSILAVAANKLHRPCRAMLNRDEDIIMTGQRHPFQGRWRIGVSNDGMLQALDIDIYNNGGYSLDLTGAVMDRAVTHVENSYWIPNVDIRGHLCRTNTHSNTAFRGFGGPQGQYIAECYITTVADKLGLDVDDVRQKNLYKEGQLTPFLQPLIDWHIPELMEELKATSSFVARKAEIADFNRTHKHKKRGIALLPTKFGISFATALHLNQAGALVHIYTDGSVLLAHGGTEMGQGLYTKMCQVAAEALNVPMSSIHTAESASNTVANPSPTAASSGSDLNGMAVQHACSQLNARLAPYRLALQTDDMKTLAHAAYLDRVNLSANGFYKTPSIGFQWGNYVDPLPMFLYFTQGCCAAEVELDTATGDHIVRRVDITMDVGHSINPAIDYGQIEGAYIQGQGLFTTEESLWTAHDGRLFTQGPGTYKIPGFQDAPRVLNTRLLKKPASQWQDLRTVQSSKGIGEPPLSLGATVLFALREAVKAAWEMRGGGVVGEGETVVLDSPATCERLRAAVGGDVWERMRTRKEPGAQGFFLCAQGETEGL